MKTDRELLELAARAAGIPIHIWGKKGSENCARMDCDVNRAWNPLTYDGDALRLAVKLDLLYVMFAVMRAQNTSGEYDTDPYAATRRAIVRAAAAIGEGM